MLVFDALVRGRVPYEVTDGPSVARTSAGALQSSGKGIGPAKMR